MENFNQKARNIGDEKARKRIASPTKLIELLDDFETKSLKSISFTSLDSFIDDLNDFKGVIAEFTRGSPVADENIKVIELLTSFSTDFKKFESEFTKDFSKLIDLTKQTYKNWGDKASTRAIVKETLNRFFIGYRQEGLWLVDIFDEIITDVQLKIETILVEMLERQLYGLSSEEIKNLPRALERFLNEIQQFFRLIKEKYVDQDRDQQIRQIDAIYKSLNQSSRKLLTEIKANLERFDQVRASLLKSLRNEVIILDQGIKKDLENEISYSEAKEQELKQVLTEKEMEIIELKKELSAKDEKIEELKDKLDSAMKEVEDKVEEEEEEQLALDVQLNDLLRQSKRTYLIIKKVAGILNIPVDEIRDLAKKEGYKTTKTRIYKKK